MSFFPPRWRNKIRRRFYSPYNKLVHRGRYFICRYFGAEFLVRSANVGGLEISAKIAEHGELENFMRGAAAIKPDIFIDVGANLGLYTCILMKNRLVPRAILFEPDRRNRVHLGANLLINDLFDANLEIHPLALGAEPGRFRLVPGPERDIGLSQIVETARQEQGQGQGFDVEVVRFDHFVALTGQTLAIKIDVERYERKVLAGMARTLRDNRGIVQIEVLEAREETVGLMTAAGFRLTQDFGPNLVFRKD
ncbi:MAG TPA: FkbM family methyltransferase [Xanthobacteraceae bacterium]|jgi:FkbM family methyltransferase|nr:FkbM family methyltransferase [Xanthobacteraceae bacterium]